MRSRRLPHAVSSTPSGSLAVEYMGRSSRLAGEAEPDRVLAVAGPLDYRIPGELGPGEGWKVSSALAPVRPCSGPGAGVTVAAVTAVVPPFVA
jgi:hypothetical protein